MKNYFKLFTSLIFLFFTACASKTVDIQPKPIDEKKLEKFSGYSCNQIDNALSFLEKEHKG